jgi:hypothetical protein
MRAKPPINRLVEEEYGWEPRARAFETLYGEAIKDYGTRLAATRLAGGAKDGKGGECSFS